MRLLQLALLLALPISLSAQFQLGWRTDTYAGINSALINPALPARTPYGWDINLGEATVFFANNYAYLKNTSLTELYRQRNSDLTFELERDLPADAKPVDGTIIYDYYDNNQYYAQELATVLGPSFSVRVAPLTRVGVFSRFQTMFSAADIEEDIGYDDWQRIVDEELFSLEKIRIAAAAWTELGINFSQGIETNAGVLTIGVSVRRLWGERAGYIVNNQRFELSKITDYVGLSGVSFDVDAAFTNNVLEEEPASTPTGKGWGADLGLLYQIDLGEGFYRWEFGASALNLGSIKFTNAQLHNYNSGQLEQLLTADYEGYEIDDGLDALAQQFSGDVFDDALASLEANEFTLGLPTTLSAHATYRFNEWIKIDANLLTSIAPFGPRLTHNSLVALSPRLDRHWWSFSLPLSLYAGEQLRLGMAARLGPVFFGTDQLGAFTKGGELTGADFYFGVKLHPLGLSRNGGSKRGKKSKGRRSGGKDVECYKF